MRPAKRTPAASPGRASATRSRRAGPRCRPGRSRGCSTRASDLASPSLNSPVIDTSPVNVGAWTTGADCTIAVEHDRQLAARARAEPVEALLGEGVPRALAAPDEADDDRPALLLAELDVGAVAGEHLARAARTDRRGTCRRRASAGPPLRCRGDGTDDGVDGRTSASAPAVDRRASEVVVGGDGRWRRRRAGRPAPAAAAARWPACWSPAVVVGVEAPAGALRRGAVDAVGVVVEPGTVLLESSVGAGRRTAVTGRSVTMPATSTASRASRWSARRAGRRRCWSPRRGRRARRSRGSRARCGRGRG